MRACFVMNRENICASCLKCFRKLFRFNDHEVNITDLFCCSSDLFYYRKSETYIGHKPSVHYVQVKPIRFTFINHCAVVGKMQKISGEKGGGENQEIKD